MASARIPKLKYMIEKIQENRASTNRHKIFSLVVAVLVVEVLLCADQDLAAASLGLRGSHSINQLQYIKG